MAQRVERNLEVEGLPTGSVDDKTLALAFQRGEKGAYQAIHDRYADRVHQVCRRMLSNPQDAQEAAQESFLKIYQALTRFNGRYQLGAWVTRIATNACLDLLRSRARRPVDDADLEILDARHEQSGDDEDPQSVFLRNVESRHVRRTLAKLPPLHRAAIVLRDFEGLSYAEVATALNITEGQAKALIHRARQNFKRSWTRLSIFVPWRLFGRARDVDAVAREHVAHAAATTGQFAPACASALQQCGQYVADRVAPVLVAGIVGVAAGGAAASQSQRSALTRPSLTEDVSARSSDVVASSQMSREKTARETAEHDAPQPAPSQTPAPVVEPEPEAQPEPEPEASSSPPPTQSSKGEASPSPSPRGPFTASVGFDWGRAIPSRVPRSHSATVDCRKNQVDQTLSTVIDDDDTATTYPALVKLHWNTAGARDGELSFEFTVWKNEREVYYSGVGAHAAEARTSDERDITFQGNYGTFSSDASSMDLPTSGRFSIRLGLDCAALSVITESVILET